MNQSKRILLPLGLALLAACGGPSIVVRHFDATQASAEIWVDGESVGTLAYKEDLSVSVEPGPHRIKALPKGTSVSPWHPGADYCEIVVEQDAVMTLVTPGDR